MMRRYNPQSSGFHSLQSASQQLSQWMQRNNAAGYVLEQQRRQREQERTSEHARRSGDSDSASDAARDVTDPSGSGWRHIDVENAGSVESPQTEFSAPSDGFWTFVRTLGALALCGLIGVSLLLLFAAQIALSRGANDEEAIVLAVVASVVGAGLGLSGLRWLRTGRTFDRETVKIVGRVRDFERGGGGAITRFRLVRHDPAGRMVIVPVELGAWGYKAAISEGDELEIFGRRRRDGVIRPKWVRNVTTKGTAWSR